jgi:non-ribosomal peptide synthetase component F
LETKNNRWALVDENGHDTPPGVGELIVASPYVASGIWVDGHCLPGSIEAGIEGSGAAPCRVFRTVDLVRQRPDGWLERIGRKDRQVKIRGTRVDLDGVEAALRKHPLGRDAGALARTNPIRWAAPVQGR